MAEKKVFAQIDVLGSNQTPMDAFIYMEDQGGGGGGSGKDVDLTPYLEFDDPENPNPRKFKITQEGYDIIYNAWHNHEDNVYKFAVGTDFVFAAKVSKTDAFGESMFWMEGSFFKTVMTYLVTDNLDVRLVNPMDITSNIEVRIEESGPVAVLDGTVLQQIVNDFQAGNNRVYIVNSLLLGQEESFDILFKAVGYDNLTRTLVLNARFNGYPIIQTKIDADGRIDYRLVSGFIGDYGNGYADPQLPTLDWIEINNQMFKVGAETPHLYVHEITSWETHTLNYYIHIKFISTSNELLDTKAKIASALYDKGYTNENSAVIATGDLWYASNLIATVVGVYASSRTSLVTMGKAYGFSINGTDISISKNNAVHTFEGSRFFDHVEQIF